jgi:predicted dehydrogenase
MHMKPDIDVVLVGLGGYGAHYLDATLDHADELGITVVGAVEVMPDRCSRINELRETGAVVCTSIDEFLAHGRADIAIISTPIQFHASQSIACLKAGVHVLCEKPPAAVVQDVLAMEQARKSSNLTLSIGYQWSFSPVIANLKRDIRAGRFGRPLRLRTLALWPRPSSYYGRASWAGRLKSDTGEWVLDSPANNATAHYLHNSLYVLGSERNTSARPVSVVAELMRANTIESFDTAAMRVHTDVGAEIVFYTSHAVPSVVGPVLHYEFEEGDVYYQAGGHFRSRMRSGEVTDYGCPDVGPITKLRDTLEAIRNGSAPACGTEATIAHSLCVCGAHESADIVDVPSEYVIAEKHGANGHDQLTWVRDLQATLVQAYGTGLLLSDLDGCPYARSGSAIDLTSYTRFRGGQKSGRSDAE